MRERIVRWARKAYLFSRDVIREFTSDRGTLFAAAISFFALISFIPLLLLAIAVFGYVIGSYDAAREQVLTFARDFIPIDITQIEENLEAISEQSGILGGLGLLGLLWTGSQVFVIIQQVMDIALGAKSRVGFIRARLTALAVVVVVGLLFALSFGITSLLTAIQAFDTRIWGLGTDDLEPFWDFLGILLPIIISILGFGLAYKFLPTEEIGTTGPLVGGITAGVLFEMAARAFRWYVTGIADFSRIYGSLGSIVVLVLWIYYVSVIAVLGAEVASVYARREEDVTGRR